MQRAGTSGRLFLGIILGFILALILAGILAPFALSHRNELPGERFFANIAVGITTRLGARTVGSNPVKGTPQAVATGRDAYNGVCAQCHGAAGKGDGIFGEATFPGATDLTSDTVKDFSDAQLYYIIKNGLSFTPMPAYGDRYSEQVLWSIVSYVRTLQDGKGGTLPVGTPTGQQVSAAELPAGADAQRGAVLFRASGCAMCHGIAPGQVALDPQVNSMVVQSVRFGQPGMPCFGPDRLSDGELADIRAFIATFPSLRGQQQPPQGPPPGGGGPGGPAGTPGRVPAAAISPCASGASIVQFVATPGRAGTPGTPSGTPGTPTR